MALDDMGLPFEGGEPRPPRLVLEGFRQVVLKGSVEHAANISLRDGDGHHEHMLLAVKALEEALEEAKDYGGYAFVDIPVTTLQNKGREDPESLKLYKYEVAGILSRMPKFKLKPGIGLIG